MSAQHIDGQFEFFDQVVLAGLLASQRSKLRPSATYVTYVLVDVQVFGLSLELSSLRLCLGGSHTWM